MKKTVGAILAGAALCLVLNAAVLPAAAKAHKRTHVAQTHHKTHAVSSAKSRIRTAQIYLNELGYDVGRADGVIGARTRAGIKAFQRDRHLAATGKLTPATAKLLAKEARSSKHGYASARDFYATHPDFYGYYDQDYADPVMLGSPQAIPSRYGNLQISEEQDGGTRQYVVTLNDQPVFHAERQPSAMNVSRTFSLDDADAILLTSYGAGDSVCPYRHHLLVLRANSNHLYEINNCTRAFEAYAAGQNLFVSFPGSYDGSALADTWRYENGLLIRL